MATRRQIAAARKNLRKGRSHRRHVKRSHKR